MKSSLLFSVISPTYHRNDLLAKCLDCLSPELQTLPFEQYEVIVGDDGYKTTAEQVIRERYPWVKWVQGPRKGPAANRNNGAKYAKGKWLVFVDDDCLPDSHWLEGYAKAIAAEPSCLVFEGRVYADRPRRTLAERAPVNESGGYLWSCNFAIKKELFESLGGFDERFPYSTMEDMDLKIRLEKEGYKIFFIKTASVCHPWKSQEGWEEYKKHRISTFIFLNIHPEMSTEINIRYYLQYSFRLLIKEIFPGIVRFRGKGICAALINFLATIYVTWIFFIKYLDRFFLRQRNKK